MCAFSLVAGLIVTALAFDAYKVFDRDFEEPQ